MYRPEQTLTAPYAPFAFTPQQITLVLISVRGFMAQEDLYVRNSVCAAKYIRNFPYYFVRKTHYITFFLRTELLYLIGSVINTEYLFYSLQNL